MVIAFSFNYDLYLFLLSLLFLYKLVAMFYTDEIINDLIACPKTLTESPKDKEGRAQYLKKTFFLSSINGEHNFSGFINQNLTFSENFSIGLIHLSKDGNKIVLLRCNGAHGGVEIHPHHSKSHVHLATAQRINAGLKPEGIIDISVTYATIEEGIRYYLEFININNPDKKKFFPTPKALGFFEDEDFEAEPF